MSLKIYNSFDEIETDLEILDLERKIAFEKMKIDLGDVKNSLSPVTIASNAWQNVTHSALSFTHKLLGN